jgi:hypothetical protein
VNGVYSASQNYNLVVLPDYSVPFTANGGEAIEVADSGVYINGTKISLDWSSAFYPPGQAGKYQRVITYANTKIDKSQIRRGTLSCGSFFAGSSYDMSTSNCIRLEIGNVSYTNYTEQGVILYDENTIWVCLDVNKQKVVDAEINSYNSAPYDYTNRHTFTTTQIVTP